MAAPTSPSNLRWSRRNAQPIPARGPLRSANRSEGPDTRLALSPPSDQSEAAPRVQTGQSKGRAARRAARPTNRGSRGRALRLLVCRWWWEVVGHTGIHWDTLGCTGIHWASLGNTLEYTAQTLWTHWGTATHWASPRDPLEPIGSPWDTLDRPWTPTGIHWEGLGSPQEYTEQDLATHWDILGHTRQLLGVQH